MSITTLNVGINRLRYALDIPKYGMEGERGELFYSFCDYVAFLEGLQRPFFTIVGKILSDRYCDLFKSLESNQERYKQLTAKEVFLLFKWLGINIFKEILDIYNKFPSNFYSQLVKSFKKDDLSSFERTLDQCDCIDFIKTLWMLRFILFGIDGNLTFENIHHSKNLWLDIPSYKYLFVKLAEKDEEAYERIVMKRLAGGKFKLSKKYRLYDSFEDIEDSETYAYFDPTISKKLKNALSDYKGDKLIGGRNNDLYTIHDLGVQLTLLVLKDCPYDDIRAIASESIKKIELVAEPIKAFTFRHYIIGMAHYILTVYYNIESILSADEKSLIKRLLTQALGVDYNSIERKSICCDTIDVHSTNDVEPNSNNGEYWTIPDDFFTDTEGKYDNTNCPNHRELEDKYTEENPKKLIRLINWLVYSKEYINKNEIYCFLLAISGKCPDKNMPFRPVKLKDAKAANKISAFIQVLCKKPGYKLLNKLFLVGEDDYKWRSQDKDHIKTVKDKINEVYRKKRNLT